MKVIRIKNLGAGSIARPRPNFLTSSLVSLLKRVAESVGQAIPQPMPAPVLVRVKR